MDVCGKICIAADCNTHFCTHIFFKCISNGYLCRKLDVCVKISIAADCNAHFCTHISFKCISNGYLCRKMDVCVKICMTAMFISVHTHFLNAF